MKARRATARRENVCFRPPEIGHEGTRAAVNTLTITPAETRLVLVAAVILTLGITGVTVPVGRPTPATERPCAHTPILLGQGAGEPVSTCATSTLSTPQFQEETGAYAFAITTHNTGDKAIDWTLGIELASVHTGIHDVMLAVSMTGGATWSSPLDIDTSGNPAFCAVRPLAPASEQTVLFRVWVPASTDERHLTLTAVTTQSSVRPTRQRLPWSWLFRSP